MPRLAYSTFSDDNFDYIVINTSTSLEFEVKEGFQGDLPAQSRHRRSTFLLTTGGLCHVYQERNRDGTSVPRAYLANQYGLTVCLFKISTFQHHNVCISGTWLGNTILNSKLLVG